MMTNYTTTSAFIDAYRAMCARIDVNAWRAQAEIDRRCQWARRSIGQQVRWMVR